MIRRGPSQDKVRLALERPHENANHGQHGELVVVVVAAALAAVVQRRRRRRQPVSSSAGHEPAMRLERREPGVGWNAHAGSVEKHEEGAAKRHDDEAEEDEELDQVLEHTDCHQQQRARLWEEEEQLHDAERREEGKEGLARDGSRGDALVRSVPPDGEHAVAVAEKMGPESVAGAG